MGNCKSVWITFEEIVGFMKTLYRVNHIQVVSIEEIQVCLKQKVGVRLQRSRLLAKTSCV